MKCQTTDYKTDSKLVLHSFLEVFYKESIDSALVSYLDNGNYHALKINEWKKYNKQEPRKAYKCNYSLNHFIINPKCDSVQSYCFYDIIIKDYYSNTDTVQNILVNKKNDNSWKVNHSASGLKRVKYAKRMAQEYPWRVPRIHQRSKAKCPSTGHQC